MSKFGASEYDYPEPLTLTALLRGRKVQYLTDAQVHVNLEIKEVLESTKESHVFHVTFTNGFKKSYNSMSELLKGIFV